MEKHYFLNKSFSKLLLSVLCSGHLFRFQAFGWSMHPFIQNGDIITIAPILSTLTVGDVVCCSTSDLPLIVHRITRIDVDQIHIKGDNLDSEDGVFSKEDILGKVIRIERNGKEQNYSIRFIAVSNCLSFLREFSFSNKIFISTHLSVYS